jgi:osmotically-inducible protein OsmY
VRTILFGFVAAALVTAACDRERETDATGTTGTTEYRATLMSEDESITSEVEANLLALPELEQDIASGRIDVETEDGVVKLEGRVGSEAEKENAMSMAWSVVGVHGVDNQLTVEHQ